MDALPGHTNFKLLQESLNATLYRAVQTDSRKPVIVKVLKIDRADASGTARFKHEYDRIRDIDSDGIVKVLDVHMTQNSVMLVLEDFGGVPMKSKLSFPLPLNRFLDIAVQLTRIVNKLHFHNVAHKGIRPGAIWYDSKQEIFKLTDFGIADELTDKHQAVGDPEVIQEVLAYISPEQTGRMNCSIDYRTDLYSLGVIFYEMLSGSVPFNAADPLMVTQAHIARPLVSLKNLVPDIPGPLSDVVDKLLAKTTEVRYQSCQGLLADLEYCRTRLARDGEIKPFEIAFRDISPRFNIPQKLVGRQFELQVLFKSFEQVCAGHSKVMLLAGKPGIGKSALVNQIIMPVTARGGYFLTGKYDQLRQNVPYSAIIQASQGLARQLLAEDEGRIADWKEKLVTALGPNGKVLTDLIPDMERIIGIQPDVPGLLTEEARNRFNLVVKNFFSVFAGKDHPLVLFLDDLQWIDQASLNLIQTLTLDRDLRYCFIVGAYRDNEMPIHHPLMLTVDSMLTAGVDLTNMELEPLDSQSVNQMLAHFLRCPPSQSESLADVVHDKTLGNPFFINQVLKKLHENGYLVLDPQQGWQWDPVAIPDEAVTGNVVVFLAERLLGLAAEPLALIKAAACIGNRFDIETLAAVTGYAIEEILDALDLLIQDGLVTFREALYRFNHDRIHEAAYSLISPPERERNHYRIGRLTLNASTSDQLNKKIFYIADQLNKAQALATEDVERARIADLHLAAGLKAKEVTAYSAAVTYLQAGTELLPPDPWQVDYHLTFTLHMELMECHYLNHNAEAAERLFHIILARAADRTDRAKAYNTVAIICLNMRTAEEAVDIGLEGLNLLGIKVSAGTGNALVLKELLQLRLKMMKTDIDAIVAHPLMTDPGMLSCMDLLVSTATPAYFINFNLYAKLILKGANLCLKYGNAPHSGVVFMALATIIQAVRNDYDQASRIGKMALDLNDKLGNKQYAGMVLYIFTFFIQHWSQHARDNLINYREVYRHCIDNGDFVYMGYCVNAATDVRLMIGDPLDSVLEEIDRHQDLMNRVKDPFIAARHRENRQFILALLGRTREPVTLSGDDYDETIHFAKVSGNKNFYNLCFTLLHKAKLYYLFGRYEDACQTSAELNKHIRVHIGTLTVSEHFFYYSLILCALLSDAETRGKQRIKRLIRRNQRKMEKWAERCPENFQHKYDLVTAEYLAATGRFKSALAHYHAAVDHALTHDYINEAALAYERLALYYSGLGAKREAGTFMTLAHQCYGQWGATAKQQDIEQNHISLLPNKREQSRLGRTGPADPDQSWAPHLDLPTVMQVTQTISGEIRRHRLLRNVVHLSLTNAGAQRCFLILASQGLPNDKGLTIEAGEDTDMTTPAGRPLPLPLDEGQGLSPAIVKYVARSMSPLILANASTQGPFINDAHVRLDRCKSILCLPIQNRGRLLGLLYLENNLATNAFTAARLEILSIIAAQAATALLNANLFDKATTDGLTKLHVHRYFQLLLDQEVKRSQRYDRPFTMIMMDVDNLKHLNDTYGRQTGDDILRVIGRTVQDNIRSTDLAARYGGDELAVMLPETETDQALVVAEKIRQQIEQAVIPCGNVKCRVTISIGLASFPHHAVDKKSLIQSADGALHAAKQAGKNRVSIGEQMNLRIIHNATLQ